MPLPVTDVERELRHTRRVRYEGYRRADGLWDIEGHLTDIKSHDNPMKSGAPGSRSTRCGCASPSTVTSPS
jgi:hypothetical protein